MNLAIFVLQILMADVKEIKEFVFLLDKTEAKPTLEQWFQDHPVLLCLRNQKSLSGLFAHQDNDYQVFGC